MVKPQSSSLWVNFGVLLLSFATAILEVFIGFQARGYFGQVFIRNLVITGCYPLEVCLGFQARGYFGLVLIGNLLVVTHWKSCHSLLPIIMLFPKHIQDEDLRLNIFTFLNATYDKWIHISAKFV